MVASRVLLLFVVAAAMAQQTNLGYERLAERRDALPPIPGVGVVATFFDDTVNIINEISHWLSSNITAGL
ncbi:hypothetical protein CORC01_02624 [Colletotrichum orchidophilum]|uniref:Uncharacterized protein n=1 Tax=Colletotrichum orchidophilum TaxID=1209926 RepID=A0A1G4BL41_9PEZI|nr:uncharacterized protein CORC01_02624 [Colletotrichum orchidophilum]OHF02045.1 hypothetical protein CORC01_02624 [Colletotrichum orchidophilum]